VGPGLTSLEPAPSRGVDRLLVAAVEVVAFLALSEVRAVAPDVALAGPAAFAELVLAVLA
jgi:hypothetical protein